MCPIISQYAGKVLSTAEEVAAGIAKRDKIRYLPTGTYTPNALGLSAQVPMKIVLSTDGSPRDIKVGKRSIIFKKTTPKNLSAKREISKLAMQTLKEIGQNKQTKEKQNRIIHLLKDEKWEDLLHDIRLALVWIRKIMQKAI